MGVPSGTTALLDLEERSLFLFPFLLLFSFTITALFSQTQLFLCSVFIFFQSIESLDLLSIAVIKGKKNPQTMWEGKDLFQLCVHHGGKSGQEFRVGTGGRS